MHLSYSGDLQAVLGKHGWLDLQTMDKFRREAPWLVPKPSSWDPPVPKTVEPPEFPAICDADDKQCRKALDKLKISPEEREKLAQASRTLTEQRAQARMLDPNFEARQEIELQSFVKDYERYQYFIDSGLDPDHPELYAKGHWVLSVWLHVTDPTAMTVLHVSGLVIVFLFTIGFCTRITSVLSWLLVLSYVQRIPTLVYGVDSMVVIGAFYLMIGP